MSEHTTEKSPRRPLSAPLGHLSVALLILLGAAGHLIYLLHDCPLALSGDEAHYWEWSRHLDWSYYSKGPLVAWIIAAGRWAFSDLSHRLLGNDELAVRLPAILLSIVTSIGMYTLAIQTLRSAALGLGAVAICSTVPMMAAGSMLMTIDAPMACAWVWMLVAIHHALRFGSFVAWLVTGVLIAIGILAKYNMVLAFPAIGMLMLTRRELRGHLLRPGPYVAAAVGLLGMVPIVLWNLQHDWVSFRHVAGQAGVGSGGKGFNPLGIAEYLGGQLVVFGPIWFPALISGLVCFWREGTDTSGANSRDSIATPDRTSDEAPWTRHFLFWTTLTPLAVFLGFSPITKIQPNWPALAYITGVIVLAAWLRDGLRAAPRRRTTRTLLAIGIALGFAGTLLIHHTEWLMPLFRVLARTAPPWDLTPVAGYDPTARLRGWRDLGRGVSEVLAEQRGAGRDPIIASDDYQTASLIAFYTAGNPPTFSFQSALGGRQSQYDIWPNPLRDPTRFVGKPVIYVGRSHPLLTGDEGKRPALPGMRQARIVEHRVAGERIQIWAIWVADSFAGFDAAAPATKHQY